MFMIDWRLTPTHQGGRTRSQIMPEKTMYVRAAESWHARPRTMQYMQKIIQNIQNMQNMPEKIMYVRAAESSYARPRPDSLVKSKAFWGYKCYRRKNIKKTELIHTVKSWLVLKIFRNYHEKVLEA